MTMLPFTWQCTTRQNGIHSQDFIRAVDSSCGLVLEWVWYSSTISKLWLFWLWRGNLGLHAFALGYRIGKGQSSQPPLESGATARWQRSAATALVIEPLWANARISRCWYVLIDYMNLLEHRVYSSKSIYMFIMFTIKIAIWGGGISDVQTRPHCGHLNKSAPPNVNPPTTKALGSPSSASPTWGTVPLKHLLLGALLTVGGSTLKQYTCNINEYPL